MAIYINVTGTVAQCTTAIAAMTSTAEEAGLLSSVQTMLTGTFTTYPDSKYFRMYGSAGLTTDGVTANFAAQPLAFVDGSGGAVGELSPNKVT